MNRKSVYSCETCSALFVCLKFFQEHRKTHVPEGQTIFPCAHCHTVHTSEYESNLHSYSHKNEPPHSCDLCQKTRGISEEEVLGSRRSIGTSTDFYVTNISLDKPMIADRGNNIINNNNNNNKNHSPDKSINSLHDRKPINIGTNHSDADNMHINNHVVDDNDDEDDDDDDEDDDDEDDEEDDDDDDEEDDDEEDDEDEDGEVDEEDEENEAVEAKQLKTELGGLCKTNVTNFIYVTNQTINHSTTPQKNYLKPARPSRSTGKGKGNRKARLTSDGDVRRKFSCHHCGKSFKTKSHLQRHILTHTGEKPYHCNRCDCRFNQSSSLRNHVIAIHTKEYPHTCNNCSKGFLMPAVLQKHLQTSECGKITNQVVEFNK